MKKYFDLKKIITPHKHMPLTIRSCLLEGASEKFEQSNDTFLNWRVGEYQYIAKDKIEVEPGDFNFKKVDDWMLKVGFKKGEQIIILYEW